jgi:hypothetical protein
MTGPGHWHWRGGTYLDHQGYRWVWTPSGYQQEHRLVAEQMLGRALAPEEVVHHRNEDRLDNRPHNLLIVPDRGTHSIDFHLRRDEHGRFQRRRTVL